MSTFDFSLPGLGRSASQRPQRVGEAIREELTLLLRETVRDPRLQTVVITSVNMAPDLMLAKINFEVAEGVDPRGVKEGLERARGFFRSTLARRLNLRATPQLVFYFDQQREKVDHLEEILAELARDRKAGDDSAD